MFDDPADKFQNCPTNPEINKNNLRKSTIKQISEKCWFALFSYGGHDYLSVTR